MVVKNNNPKIILSLFSVIIGILIAIQIRSNVEHYLPVTINALEMTQNEIIVLNNEIKEFEETIKAKEEELEILDSISKGDENIIDILSMDIKNNKMNSGQVSLKGPGITILMYDNQEIRDFGYDLNRDIIHDIDILNIINDLRIAGAEAISVNGERVLSTSEIKCAGPTIRINGRSSATPFVIKAIGNPKLLIASVNAPGTNGDILKNVYNKGFEITVEDLVNIPGYRGIFNFKYAKPLGEED